MTTSKPPALSPVSRVEATRAKWGSGDQPDVTAPPSPETVTTYLEDGARIAAILLVWGVLTWFFRYGLTAFPGLDVVFGFVGVLNAVLYVAYRTLDYHHALAEDG